MELQRPMGRVWPNGEFSLWSESKAAIADPEHASDIGLSKVSNSQKFEENCPDVVRRGLKGITSYGSRMVRNSAFLLQKRFGGRKLSFVTCTIPGSPEMTLKVARSWAEIVRRYYSQLRKALLDNGLCPVIVGVTEIQPKRFARTGGMPLHLHLVFQGAIEDSRWVFTPNFFAELWSRVVGSVVPEMKSQSFASSTNVQRVKKSAEGYLGKYISKGSGDIAELLEKTPHLAEFLPSTWYNLTSEARNLVKQNTKYGPGVGERLERWSTWTDSLDSPFKEINRVRLTNPDGVVVVTFVVGVLQAHWRKVIGVPIDPYEIRGL